MIIINNNNRIIITQTNNNKSITDTINDKLYSLILTLRVATAVV